MHYTLNTTQLQLSTCETKKNTFSYSSYRLYAFYESFMLLHFFHF